MRPTSKVPIAGEPMTVDWARNVGADARANRILQGVGYRVTHTPNGTILHIDGGKTVETSVSAGIAPWTVRWHELEKDGEVKGEWLVYAPPGSFGILQHKAIGDKNLVGMLLNADTDLYEGDVGKWFKIEPLKDDADAVTAPEGSLEGLRWTIKLFIYPWARGEVGSRIAYKCAWEIPIANIYEYEYEENGENKVKREVVQLYTGAIAKDWNEHAPFAVCYELEDENEKDSDYTVTVKNQKVMLGRKQYIVESETDIKDRSDVWLLINHAGKEYSAEVKTEDPGETNDDQTVVKLYTLEDNIVMSDFREDIEDMPFYTNAPDESNGDSGSSES